MISQKGEKDKVVGNSRENPDWKDWIWCEGNGEKKAWSFMKLSMVLECQKRPVEQEAGYR